MGFALTQEQQAIVDDAGGELLVSAAAGSGKTRVLVERLLKRVQEEKLDIDQFLVITYTKAAAAELRTRIAQELSARLAENPTDRHLRRQTTLVYKAQISTIHSLCSSLLRECGHLLDLDADFRLCDEGEARVLMGQTLEAVLERRYEVLDGQADFAALLDMLSAGRDDTRLMEIVLDIHDKIQSHPAPTRWLREQEQMWDLTEVTDFATTIWGEVLLKTAREELLWCQNQLAFALRLCGEDELLSMNYAPSISATLETLAQFSQSKSWDACSSCLPIEFPAVGRKKKYSVEPSPMQQKAAQTALERIKSVRDTCKKQIQNVCEPIMQATSEIKAEFTELQPVVRALMQLVQEFETEYAAQKRRRNVLGFSDLEHFAAQLLVDENGAQTPTAKEYAARFCEVQVDEYQDTNQVQNLIFKAISNNGQTLFQVGDVKQSIYRFRLADPTIFLGKYHRFPYADNAPSGAAHKRIMSANFRSRGEVLEGCNDLFKNIMSTEFGEIDYTDDQALVTGTGFPAGEDYALTLNFIDSSFLGEQEGEKDSKDLIEARCTAREIRAMLDKPFLISEGEGLRGVRPSDFMILMRSPNSMLHHYIKALNEQGIPWMSSRGEDFFATTEVNVALALLQIVDNPRQDVALVAALRSPVFNFTADRLAHLRTYSKGDFYDAVVQAAQQGDEQCQAFLHQLEQLRFCAGDKSCRQMLWHIYEQTNILGIFGAMQGGEQRQNHLLSLYALACEQENGGCRTLFEFLNRLDRLRENNFKLKQNGTQGSAGGVSLLSIHQSKGLEKPIVFVCGLTRQFNREDEKRPVLFHPHLGVGPKGLDAQRMLEYPTLARKAIAQRLKQERLSEELRILYVAMTRAREKLILNLTLKSGAKELGQLAEGLSSPVSPVVLRRQSSVGHWIMLHALTRPEGMEIRALAQLPAQEFASQTGQPWTMRWVEGQQFDQPPAPMGHLADAPEQSAPEIDAILLEKMNWVYPHKEMANIPSKITATQIKGRLLDQEVVENGVQVSRPTMQDHRMMQPEFFKQEKGLTPAQRGTALHQAMQYLTLQGEITLQTIQGQIDKLVEKKYLTAMQGEAVSAETLLDFFNSEIGQELLHAKNLHREFKFSVLVPVKDYFPTERGDEQILLQGVIDAWFENAQGITVLDFKSDAVKAGQEQERAVQYKPQLDAYSRALEKILGRAVHRRVIWFFATSTSVVI